MKLSLTRIASTALLCLVAGATTAKADTFAIQYFTVNSGTPDFYKNGTANVAPGTGVSTNYVTSFLTNGMPTYNPGRTNNNSLAPGGSVFSPTAAYLGAGNELLYWTPGAGGVTADGTGTITLGAAPVTMYAPGTGGTDSSKEETAIITGFFTVAPGQTDTVTFDVGADDAAFVYVDGTLVLSLGGIHNDTVVPSTTHTYGAGVHEIQIFYADLNTTDAELSFTDTGVIGGLSITPTAATPEPSSLVLLGTGLIGAARAIRRRISR